MNMAINDMELDNVTGGATRTVKNNSLKYVNIREGAGLKSKVITKLNNGTKVKTTGNKIKKDGYVWYEITLENGSRAAHGAKHLPFCAAAIRRRRLSQWGIETRH